MPTTAQVFYPTNDDQDQSWGTDVRRLEESADTNNTASQTNHPNAAGTTFITLDPLTVRTSQTDERTLYGWAWNEDVGAYAMDSETGARRTVPAGDWVFDWTVTVPQAGGTTGTIDVDFSASVYRVASGGGSRTLLFQTGQSSQVSSTGLSGAVSGTCSETHSASQIILEAGETLHVAYTTRCIQVAGLLGATVAGNLTWAFGGSNATQITLPSPGIRTRYSQSVSAVMRGVAALVRKIKKPLTAVMVGVASLSRRLILHRPIYNTDGTPDASGNRRHGVLIGTVKPWLIPNLFSNFVSDFEFPGTDADDNSSGIRSAEPIQWSNTFTLECAIRKDRTITSEVPIAWADYSNGNLYEGLQLVLTASNASAQLWKAEALQAGVSKGSIISNAAHWVAFVSDGVTLSFYLDGVRLGTGAITANPTGAYYLWLGRTARDPTSPAAGDPFPFDGVVEEVRLSSVARYAGASYTVPAVAFTPDADTMLLWHLDDYMPLRALGVPTLARRITAFRVLAATMLGIASLARRVVAFRVLPVVMLGVASLARRITAFRVFSATMLGVPSLSPHVTAFREFVAVMLGAPILERLIVAQRELAAVMRGVASRPIILLRRTISAVAVGIASRTNRVGKTLAAAMLGVPSISRLLRKLLEARAAGVATMTKLATLRREIAARMVGIARARIEMGLEVLSRIGSGAVTIVKKIFPVFDD